MYAATCEHVRREAALSGVALSGDQLAQLSRYLDLLLVWNQKINLTSVKTPEGVANKHFLDSLAVVPFLHPVSTLVDVGSGAGFPGIPLAIAIPSLQVTLVESNGKKAAFLRRTVEALGLRKCEVLQIRVEDLKAKGRTYDYAISRATFPPEKWLDHARALVGERGTIIAMTGREAPPETPSLDRIFSYMLPSGETRHLGIYVSRGTAAEPPSQ